MRNLNRTLFALALGTATMSLAAPQDAALAQAQGGGPQAPDLAWDDQNCGRLVVTEATHSGKPGAIRATGYRVVLDEADGGSAEAAHLTAKALRTDGPVSLDPLPRLFSGGLLIGLEEHKPKACDLQHGFERAAEVVANLPEGAVANQRWSGVNLVSKRNTVDASTISLHVESLPHDLMRAAEDITGFSSAGSDAGGSPIGHVVVRISAPRSRLQALSRGETLSPTDTVTIEQVSMISGDARIEAHGTYQPATRSGHLEVHAVDMEGIKGAFPASVRDKVGAGFLILRLAAKHDDNGALSWDVDFSGSSITVNGVSLPMVY